ncbi:CAP domain-containing protein [filamentous cyanobacterium LEGE 07170]|nr:CAP domain-containing protein [filamentous cyanobacterium LEGE 07170]
MKRLGISHLGIAVLLSSLFSAVQACEVNSAIAPTSTPQPASPELAQAESAIDIRVDPMEVAVLEQINAHRQSIGLTPLEPNPVIIAQAREHSQRMASESDLNHDGFSDRVAAIASTLSYSSAGENVASNQGFSDPVAQAVEGWLNSTGHRDNIEGNFNTTGIGVAQAADGSYYFTQIFIQTR